MSVSNDSQQLPSRRALWSWVVYDWGSNSFATVIQTFVFATYFARSVAPSETTGQAWWGWAMAGAALAVAFAAPCMGAAVDGSGRRKPWIFATTALCIAAMAAMWFIQPNQDWVWLALLLGVIGTIGAELALVPYNALLADMVPRHRVGRWSGIGWAAGYAGGLMCLIAVLLLFVEDQSVVAQWLGVEHAKSIRASFVFCALWYAAFALPLFFMTPECLRSSPEDEKKPGTWQRLVDGLKALPKRPNIFRFLIARLLYTDGIATLFAMGAVYAAGVFGMDASRVVWFGIIITGAAGVGAFGFAFIDERIGPRPTILVSLVGLIIGCCGALLAPTEAWLWASAVVVGIFVGPAQAASRSLMAHLAPADERGELFGLFAFSGKVMAFMGPASVATVTWLTNSQRWGMSTILIFLVSGAVLMLSVRDHDHGRA